MKKLITDGQELSIQDQYFTQRFAESLVNRASETLDGEEISIIGILLPCWIVAKYFQLELQRIIQNKRDGIVKEETQILPDQKFDLLSMYRRLMETNRQLFRGEKANNASASNQIVDYAVECLIKKIESHLNGHRNHVQRSGKSQSFISSTVTLSDKGRKGWRRKVHDRIGP